MADETQGWTVVTEAPAPSSSVARPSTTAGLTLASTGGAVPLATRVAMEAATHPGMARAGSTVGQIVGGVEGAMHGGPMGAAGGVWTGGKAGWFTGKLAQRLSAPVASALDKVAPYAQTLSTLGGAAGVGDLAQMAEPNRRDIGFLGIGPTMPDSQPALINAALASIAERMGHAELANKIRGRSAQPSASQSTDDPSWYRSDGTRKGNGFLGVIRRPDGKVSSEISIGVNINGKEVEIPTLVPTLSAQERDWLINNDVTDPKKIPAAIIQKAVDFARPRIAAGKSPFAQAGEEIRGR